ncbi:MAG: NUDIX domain-containing protein [Clostridiales bacterium]|nr:NUDIX domain-containing protein [Clostridiales bacterium]
MRLLFEIDKKNYGSCSRTFTRNSARAIIIRDGRIAMVHSQKFDYYKFPGGGIEPGESRKAAVIRETLEEAGLVVKPESVREYGCVHRVQRSTKDAHERFVQDNYYYFCEVSDEVMPQKLDGYEDAEGFTLEFVEPDEAIAVNRTRDHGRKDRDMIEREAKVLEMLIHEGYFFR